MKDGTTSPLPLTIAIGSIQGWPAIRANVETFRVAAEAVSGELIVADGSENSAPAQDEIGPHTIWLSEPGSSVFQLRRLAYRRARVRSWRSPRIIAWLPTTGDDRS